MFTLLARYWIISDSGLIIKLLENMLYPPMYHANEVIKEYKRENPRPSTKQLASLICRSINAKLRPISWEEDVVIVDDIPYLIGPMRRYVHKIHNGYWETFVIAG